MGEEAVLRELARNVDTLVALMAADLAVRVAEKGGGQKEQIAALAATGLDNRVIARVLGTRVEAVRARLSEARRSRKKRPKGK